MKSINTQFQTKKDTDSSSRETRNLLIESGTRAFYEKGFTKANLRQICADCGLTTGAFYFLFESKDALLKAIVDPVASEGRELCALLSQQELEGKSTAPETGRILMKFLLFHRREIIIIMEKSKGSCRELYRDEIIEALTRFQTDILAKSLGREPKKEVVDILVEVRVKMLLSLLHRAENEADQTLFLNDVLAQFAQGGRDRLIENLRDVL